MPRRSVLPNAVATFVGATRIVLSNPFLPIAKARISEIVCPPVSIRINTRGITRCSDLIAESLSQCPHAMILGNRKLTIVLKIVIDGIGRTVTLQALQNEVSLGRCVGCSFSIGIDVHAIRNAKTFAFGDISLPLIVRAPLAVIVNESNSENRKIDTISLGLFPIYGSIMVANIDALPDNSFSRARGIAGIRIDPAVVILNRQHTVRIAPTVLKTRFLLIGCRVLGTLGNALSRIVVSLSRILLGRLRRRGPARFRRIGRCGLRTRSRFASIA